MPFYCEHRKVLRFSGSYLSRTISWRLHFDWNYNSDSEHVINTSNRLYCVIWHRINAPTMRRYFGSSLEWSSFVTLHIKFRIISPEREKWSSHSQRASELSALRALHHTVKCESHTRFVLMHALWTLTFHTKIRAYDQSHCTPFKSENGDGQREDWGERKIKSLSNTLRHRASYHKQLVFKPFRQLAYNAPYSIEYWPFRMYHRVE